MTAWTSRAPIAASVATLWPATRVSVCLATREKTANQVGPVLPENRTARAFYALTCYTIAKRLALVCCSYPRRDHTAPGQGRSAIGQCRTGERHLIKQGSVHVVVITCITCTGHHGKGGGEVFVFYGRVCTVEWHSLLKYVRVHGTF